MENKVAVEIFGDTYNLKTDADPQYIKEVAKVVDKHMKDVAGRTKSFAPHKVAVLAALELADEYCKMKHDYDELFEILEDK